jgi:hypothetical protein
VRVPGPRTRLAVLFAAGAVAGAGYRQINGPSLDGPFFTFGGHRLLSGAGLHVYATPGQQGGPLELLVAGSLGAGLLFAALTSGLTAATLVAGLRWLAPAERAGRRAVREAVVVVLGTGWGIVTCAYSGGHTAEIAVPLSWGLAVAASRGRRGWMVAGLALAVGTGFETWGLLGAPALLLLPGWADRIRAGAVAAGGTLVLYLPFVIAGPFRMGQLRWPINPHALVHQLDPSLTSFGWICRLAQAGFVVATGIFLIAVARRAESRRALVWLLPAVLVLAKCATDPMVRDYYWSPLSAALLLGLASANRPLQAPVLAAGVALPVSLVLPLQVPAVELAALAVLVLAPGATPRLRTAGDQDTPSYGAKSGHPPFEVVGGGPAGGA